MKKKSYTQPALEIVYLKTDKHLLGASDYKVNAYEDGGTNDVGDTED